MKNLILLAGVWGLVGVAAGCGKDDHANVIESGGTRNNMLPSGKGGKGGSSNEGGDAPAAGGADASSDGLAVTITAPTAASDPVADDVIVDDQVTVLCLVGAGVSGGAPDPSTVLIELLDADGEPALGADNKAVRFSGVPTGETDEYSAKFVLAAIPTGVVGFRCSGKGVDAALAGSATVSTFLDHGPTIVEKLPEENAARPLEQVLNVEFTVTPTPLSDDDTEAEVADITLYVAGKEIVDVAEDPDSPGSYKASVDFQDEVLFEEPPQEHTSVRIEATNTRSPKPATGVRDYPFVVDGDGPIITFTTKANAAIRGETSVSFTVTDSGSGLDTDTLKLTMSGLKDPTTYSKVDTSTWDRQGNTFTFRFDTGRLEDIESQITVVVDADDIAGNPGQGQTLFLYLDDKAPLIDLDPLNARGLDSQKACSASFDPLGEALNDGDVTLVRQNRIRALIYDETNHGSGQTVFYMSGTDQATARLYIQPNPSEPFLKDTNDDGVCDALASEDFEKLTLRSIKKTGLLQYSLTDFALAPAVPQNQSLCKLRAPGGAPDPLCMKTSDMTVVIQHDVDTKADEPVVYGMGDLSGFECTGSNWDIYNAGARDGWVCFAARASDGLGNVGISRPLRICFDDPNTDTHPTCAVASEEPPSCTTGCVAPPQFPAHIFRAF